MNELFIHKKGEDIIMKRQFIIGLLIALYLSTMTGCANSQPARLANEIHFDISNISELCISYDEENITFYESDNDELVIKEYMSKDKDSYYANVSQSSDSIKVSEGGKPFFKGGFSRYIEVYFPKEYRGNLTVTTTDGNIDISKVSLILSSLRIDSTEGTVSISSAEASSIDLSSTRGTFNLGTIVADEIDLETTKGEFNCEKLEGNVSYTSTSGDIEVKSAVGSGSYEASNSGDLTINYTEVTGDLSFYNKNDSVNLTLPKGLEFEFEASTKNGSVSTSFDDYISSDGDTSSGTIGSNPTVSVYLETRNGDINVTQ